MADLTGQVGIVMHGTTFWPKVIERVTNSHSHHVVVAVSPTHCIGAQPGGARLRPITDFHNVTWSRFELTDLQRWGIGFYCRSLINAPYNYAAFVLIGLRFMLHAKIPGWLQRAVSTTYRVECAQLADSALTAVDATAFDDGREPGLVFPGSWEQLFIKRGWL
jgi:hypothetical protein